MTTRRKFMGTMAALSMAVTAQAEESTARRTRKPVIPIEVIKQYEMQPAVEGTFGVLGFDEQVYSLDDTLRVIFEMTKPHWNFDTPVKTMKKVK